MKLSVIIPVYNRPQDLTQCLEALTRSSRVADEIIVVDDGSTDNSAEIASQFGANVVRLATGPHGPALARNRGAKVARGEILLFLDSDVLVHADTLATIERTFDSQKDLCGLFGSYDDSPPIRSIISLYKNLVHHYVHQNSRREASTFWAGCGAIRRTAFESCGGFDERYVQPSIEDIELGTRMARQGMLLWSCPDILCTHLKEWTFPGLIKTDIFQRALPWSRLIRTSGTLPNDLNVGWANRFSAASAWLLIFSLIGLLVSPWAGIGLIAATFLLVACNYKMLYFFWKKEGFAFVVCALSLHTFYLLYSSFVFVMVTVHSWVYEPKHIVVPKASYAVPNSD